MQSPEALMGAAQAQTGLEDFGEASFREGLDRLVASLQDEAALSEMGEVVLPYLVTNLLAQRLQVEDWYRRHPEIDGEPIVAPLIGLGLPRTGSTALSFLLAEDPAARSLRRWEATDPCPPPSTVEGGLHAGGEDVSVVLETERGTTTIRGETILSTFMVLGPLEGFRLQQAIVRFEWDGEQANGMLERSTAAG